MNKKAFTLIELLAVIVILAIILLIAIPSVTKIVTEARKDTLVSSAKLISKAILPDALQNGTNSYKLDSNGKLYRIEKDGVTNTEIKYSGKVISLNDNDVIIVIYGKVVTISEGILCEKSRNWCLIKGTPLIYITSDSPVSANNIQNSDYVPVPNSCFNYTTNVSNAFITGYNVSELCPTNPIVPLNIGGYSVTKILEIKASLTAIEIPMSVTEIGDGAFLFVNSLSKVKFNDGLITIGEAAFSYTALKTVTIPNSVKYIKNDAFLSSDIDTITLGTGLSCPCGGGILESSIWNEAFSTNNIEVLTLPSSMKYIQGFNNNEIATLNLNEGLEYIGDFSNNNLTTVIIPSTVDTISVGAFLNNPLAESASPSVTVLGDADRFDGAGWANIFGTATRIE